MRSEIVNDDEARMLLAWRLAGHRGVVRWLARHVREGVVVDAADVAPVDVPLTAEPTVVAGSDGRPRRAPPPLPSRESAPSPEA